MTDEWLDIESAPRDGTEVIGASFRDWGSGSTLSSGPWTVAFRHGQWRSSWDGSSVLEYMDDVGSRYREPDVDPTHWMPMPALPVR